MNCLICKTQDGVDAPGVCPACLADAKLGRLVRPRLDEWERNMRWFEKNYVECDTQHHADQMKEALEKAMGEAK